MTRIDRFASLEDLTATVLRSIAAGGEDYGDGLSTKRALDMLSKGDPTLVGVTNDALMALQSESSEEERVQTIASVVGPRVSVPAFLSGTPNAMRRRVRRQATTRHMSIYVDTGVDSAVSTTDALARGQAILGAIEAITAAQISVDLHVCTNIGNDDHWFVTRLETRPLDLSVLGFALAHPAFQRTLMWNIASNLHAWSGSYAPTFRRMVTRDADYAGYETWSRQTLGLAPTDLYVPRAYSGDPCMRNPKAWINATLERLLS